MSNENVTSQLDTQTTQNISSNGNERVATSSSQVSTSSEVLALFKAETTLFVWLCFLAIGGGILALYYARIGYLPDIEWSSTLIYLAAATMIGGTIGLLFVMSLFLPGFIWSEYLIFESKLRLMFCYDKTANEPCARTIMWRVGLPFGVALLLSHLSLAEDLRANSSRQELLAVYLGVSLALLVLAFCYMRMTFGQTRSVEDLKQRFKCASFFTLSLLLSQISILVMYLLSAPQGLGSFIALTFICTLGVLISNHIVALRYHHHFRQAIVASLVATGFLLFTADWFSPVSLKIMGYYGWGDGRKVSLLLNNEGCQIVTGLGLSQTQCALTPNLKLSNVEILSSVGDEYLLSVDGKTLTLPRNMVLSYQGEDRRPKPASSQLIESSQH